MKKILLSMMALISVISLTGCILDDKLYDYDKMEAYVQENCANDVKLERTYDPVETGSKGNIWHASLERDASKKFFIYNYLTKESGYVYAHNTTCSDFATVWLKPLFNQYTSNHDFSSKIKVEYANNIYYDGCVNLVFHVDCENGVVKEEEQKDIDDFANYVREQDFVFPEDNDTYGYKVFCKES